MRHFWNDFWATYEKHYTFNVGLAAALFLLQIVHLYWLATDVIAVRLLGQSLFHPPHFWKTVIVIVDYTEIPALISTSLLYIYELRQGFAWGSLLSLLLINTQWLHLLWLTDDIVVQELLERGREDFLPIWLAWVAILLDYLEFPVMVSTVQRLLRALRDGNVATPSR